MTLSLFFIIPQLWMIEDVVVTFHSLLLKTMPETFPFFQFLFSVPFLSYIPLLTTWSLLLVTALHHFDGQILNFWSSIFLFLFGNISRAMVVQWLPQIPQKFKTATNNFDRTLPDSKTFGTTPFRCWIMWRACSSRSKFFFTIILLNNSKSSPAQICSNID